MICERGIYIKVMFHAQLYYSGVIVQLMINDVCLYREMRACLLIKLGCLFSRVSYD